MQGINKEEVAKTTKQISEKSKGFLKEFREFAVKGNAIDMAVGIVIGAAFGKIISSIVGDVLMPLVGKLTGSIDFSNRFLVLGPGKFTTAADAKAAGVATLNYGLLLNATVDFVLVAFAIFVVVKLINKAKRAEAAAPAAPAAPPQDVQVLMEIRDLLKKQA